MRAHRFSEVRVEPAIDLGSSVEAEGQPAEPRKGKNSTAIHRADSLPRRFLIEAQMRSVFVVVADIVGQQAFQMRFIECDQIV